MGCGCGVFNIYIISYITCWPGRCIVEIGKAYNLKMFIDGAVINYMIMAIGAFKLWLHIKPVQILFKIIEIMQSFVDNEIHQNCNLSFSLSKLILDFFHLLIDIIILLLHFCEWSNI